MIIIGDDNVCNFSHLIPSNSIEIHSFASLRCSNLISILERFTPTPSTSLVIFSFGPSEAFSSFKKFFHKFLSLARSSFPNAAISIPLLNSSICNWADRFNAEINNAFQRLHGFYSIRPIPSESFHLKSDRKTWCKKTSEDIWSHWLSHIDARLSVTSKNE